VKWQTPHIRRYETDLDPIQSLFSFCPTQVLTYLFNSTQQESATRENVAAIMKSRYPVSVYVLSGVNSDDNDQTPEQKKMMQKREEGLEYLFQEYPSRLFKFRTVDFFKPEQNVSSSMTIDKVAELYGAFKLFGGPVLLLHTGHTIWYGALDATGNLLGEGISPGLGIRFQSLNDYCGPEFPMIEHQEFVDAISQASKDRKPLPMFGTDVKTSMIANISSELYGQLRNIVKQFESKVLYDVDPQNGSAVVTKEDVNVVITGRDGLIVKKLLNEGPDIVDVEQGVKSPKTKPSTYIVRRSMWTTAMQMLLSEHVGSEKPIDPDDEIRDAILGLRVAKAEIVSTGITSSQDVVRGTVVRISKGNQLEHDLYKILYDNAIQTWVDQVDLYGKFARRKP
jgi:pantothenate kinase type III